MKTLQKSHFDKKYTVRSTIIRFTRMSLHEWQNKLQISALTKNRVESTFYKQYTTCTKSFLLGQHNLQLEVLKCILYDPERPALPKEKCARPAELITLIKASILEVQEQRYFTVVKAPTYATPSMPHYECSLEDDVHDILYKKYI